MSRYHVNFLKFNWSLCPVDLCLLQRFHLQLLQAAAGVVRDTFYRNNLNVSLQQLSHQIFLHLEKQRKSDVMLQKRGTTVYHQHFCSMLQHHLRVSGSLLCYDTHSGPLVALQQLHRGLVQSSVRWRCAEQVPIPLPVGQARGRGSKRDLQHQRTCDGRQTSVIFCG